MEGLHFPTVYLPVLKVEPKEENGSKTISWCQNEKPVDLLYLGNNEDQSSSIDEFIESQSVEKIKFEKEDLDQKDSDLFTKASCDISFIKVQIESNNRNINNNAFDYDVMENVAIKKETDDNVNEAAIEELNCNNGSTGNFEIVKLEEIYIKPEEDEEDRPHQNCRKYNEEESISEGEFEKSAPVKIGENKKNTLNKGIHQCLECPYKTSRKTDLKYHAEIHNSNKLILKCSECSYETSKSRNLKHHQIKHKTNVQWLHCIECSFKSYQRSIFRNHMLMHKGEVFKCPNCPYQTRRKCLLTIHQLKHESTDKWHSCPLCPYKTYDKKNLKAHCRRRHRNHSSYSDLSTIFKCTECSYESVCKSDLKKHSRRRHKNHSDNFEQTAIFKCTKCSYEGVCKSDVKTHLLIHDQGSWLQCRDCTFKTHYKTNMRKHQARHKSAEEIEQCNFKSVDITSLSERQSSTKEAQKIEWRCVKCEYKTLHKSNLKRHQLRHEEAHEAIWLSCYECSFKTKHRQSLVHHISKHKCQIGKG